MMAGGRQNILAYPAASAKEEAIRANVAALEDRPGSALLSLKGKNNFPVLLHTDDYPATFFRLCHKGFAECADL